MYILKNNQKKLLLMYISVQTNVKLVQRDPCYLSNLMAKLGQRENTDFQNYDSS